MSSSYCLAARNIGGYTSKFNHREMDRDIERRLIRALHLAEKSIRRFKIGYPGIATGLAQEASSICMNKRCLIGQFAAI
jgi:hypothetical protein